MFTTFMHSNRYVDTVKGYVVLSILYLQALFVVAIPGSDVVVQTMYACLLYPIYRLKMEINLHRTRFKIC